MTAPLPYDLETLDPEESGPLACLLDRIAVEGVPPVDGPAFARWLYGTIITQQERFHQLQADYRDYVDEHPDQQAIVPDAKTFYHATKPEAEKVAAVLREDKRVAQVAIQLEPNNGWMIVVVPGLADLHDLAGVAEIQDGTKPAVPIGKARALQPLKSPGQRDIGAGSGGGPQSPAAAPTRGVTAQVWAIADTCFVEKGHVDRPAIMALCAAAGINAATAGTQYSKWKKARGL